MPGGPADQPEEDRHERQREQHQARGDEVERGDEDENGDRHHDREHELRQGAAEQPCQRVDAGDGGGRDLGALGSVERGRIALQPGRDEVEPQLRQHPGRSVGADRLESPGRARPRHDHDGEQHERRRHVRERGAVERARGDAGKEDGLREDEERGHDAEGGIGSERNACGARAAEEARIERSHDSESTPGRQRSGAGAIGLWS